MKRILTVLAGCLSISLGILIFKYAHITTGGTTGLALNLAYWLQIPFDGLFFVVNTPFYILSLKRLGWKFTASTLLSVVTVVLLTGVERVLPAMQLDPLFGALAGGVLAGLGLSLLFMGQSSLGGTGVLTVYVQQRYGWDPGKLNFCFDAVIVGSSMLVVGAGEALFSALSIVVVSSVISLFRKRIASSYRTPAAHAEAA